jgi:signal transduction histidine kinase
MVLLVALALFVAQAINFATFLSDRRQARYDQATGPAVARIVDAVERAKAGRILPSNRDNGRGRVQLLPASPVNPAGEHRSDVENGLRSELHDAGLEFGRIETEVRDFQPDDRRLRHMGRRFADRARRSGGEVIIAVEQPGQGWYVLRAPWPRAEAYLVWRLFWQTIILWVIVLIPVAWAARRIAKPLRTLAAATRGFRPGETAVPVAEAGPQDVRDVIAAFNALALRVTAMLDEKDRMLGAIGHDLRTPLAALRVRIESVEDDDDRIKMADTIDEMNRTLDDILSLARLGRPSEPLTEVDIAALVEAVVDDFLDLGAEVACEESARLRMRLRPSLMRRALRNLIENALKYGSEVEVKLVDTPRQVSIMVCDRGPGIPEDRLNDVFEAFTRLESSRNKETGGIGLGLALTRAIVREAGGDVILANRDGGGLEAVITLPR